MKEACEIGRGGGGKFSGRNAVQAGEGFRRVRDHGRLIALAAPGAGSKPGSVGFHEHGRKRQTGSNIAEILRPGIRQVARKGDEESQVLGAHGLLPAAAETMHDAAQSGVPPVSIKHEEEILPRVIGLVRTAAVDEDGALARGGNFELSDQACTLHVVGGAVVVIVEADFAAGDHLGLCQELIQLGDGGGVCVRRVVRVNSRAGKETRHTRLAIELATNIEGLVHLAGAFADPNGEHCAHAGSSTAPQHFRTVGVVAGAVNVRVGIDEQNRVLRKSGNGRPQPNRSSPTFYEALWAPLSVRASEMGHAKLIAMVNVKARPRSPQLQPFIRSFHYHEAELANGLERIMPSGQAHLMVNLAEDEFRTYDRVRPERKERHCGAVFSGPHSQSTILDTAQFRWLTAVEFRSGGVGYFLGIPANEASNSVLNTDDLWRTDGAKLRERLLEAHSPEQRFAILEELLLAHLDREFDAAVAWAIAALERGMRVSEVARRLGLLPRTLERRFTAKVGLTPKRFARVRRLQSAMRSIRDSPACDWVALAAQYGYCDQSHLVHEFRELADIAPSAYKPQSRARNNHVPLAAQ
jgi:AraC-like DNA-binding protein